LTRRAQQRRRPGGEREPFAFEERFRRVLPVEAEEFRFVIVEVEVGRGAGEVQVNHPLGLAREVWLALSKRIDNRGRLRCRIGRGLSFCPVGHQRGEREPAEPDAGLLKEMAASLRLQVFEQRIHGVSYQLRVSADR